MSCSRTYGPVCLARELEPARIVGHDDPFLHHAAILARVEPGADPLRDELVDTRLR